MKKILYILLIIALSVVGYFWFSAQNQTEEISQPDTSSQASGQATKDYQSAKFQIAFQYPASWVLTESEPGLIILKPTRDISDDLAPISIDVRGEEPYLDALREIQSVVLDKTEMPLSFGAYKAVAISGRLSPTVGERANSPMTFTMIDHAGRLFSIDYSEFDPAMQSAREVYRAIVASFKFIEVQ